MRCASPLFEHTPCAWVQKLQAFRMFNYQLHGCVLIFDKGKSTLNLSNEVYSPANPSMSKPAKPPSSSTKVHRFVPMGVWTCDLQHRSPTLYQFSHTWIDNISCNIGAVFVCRYVIAIWLAHSLSNREIVGSNPGAGNKERIKLRKIEGRLPLKN
jgi:hypothetical protein